MRATLRQPPSWRGRHRLLARAPSGERGSRRMHRNPCFGSCIRSAAQRCVRVRLRGLRQAQNPHGNAPSRTSAHDRDWFKANRRRYDQYLVEPARALAERLSALGEPHFFRPYNDTRFHLRPPIKEQLGVAIGYGGSGGFYFELSLDGLLIAAGLHQPASDQLERFRAALDDGRRAEGFERAVRVAGDAGLALPPPELKRSTRVCAGPSPNRPVAPQGDHRLSPP